MLRKISILAAAFAAVTLFTSQLAVSQISGGVNGSPVIATGGTTGTSSAAYIDAYVASIGAAGVIATDVCQRIQWVYANLIPAGGSATVDARGFTGTGWGCTVNPFASGTGLTGKSGKLLLGYIDIPAKVTWVIPGHIILEGIGTNSTGTAGANTIIHADSMITQGLGSALAVLQMGLAGPGVGFTFGVQVRNLTVDCSGVSGTTGILNLNAEEGSLINNVSIYDCPLYGLHVSTNQNNSSGHGAVNSGPYQNVSISFTSSCTGCTSSAIGLLIEGDDSSSSVGRSIRGFDNFTVSGNRVSCCQSVGSGLFGIVPVVIYGVSTDLTNSHIEYCSAVCIQIGNNSTYATYGVRISDVTVGNDNLNYDVQTYTANTVANVLIENLNHESINTHTINDMVTGYTVPDNYVGWYWLGVGSVANSTPAVFTSSNDMSPGTADELRVPGNMSKGAGSFRIDHPLDPAHEYLYHSFVESPDMMNIYNGSVTTDQHGLATVTLPDYFEALNRDFRYQLTPVGQFAQAIVAEKVKGNRFVIQTDKPGVEVSWQVTGVRHDDYANQHRIPVEEKKPQPLTRQ